MNWIRLITGHNRLKVNMYKMRLTEHPNCDCGTGREDAEHVLLVCPKYNDRDAALLLNIADGIPIMTSPKLDAAFDMARLKCSG